MTGIEDKIRDLVKQAGKEKRLGDKRAEQFYNSLFSGEALPIFALVGLIDTGGDHELYLKCNENLAAGRILNLVVGDVERTITLSGNPTLADWFNQSVKQAASPTFVSVILNAGALFIADSPVTGIDMENDSYLISIMHTHSNTGWHVPYWRFRRSKGTNAAPTAVVDTNPIGWLDWNEYDGSGYYTGAQIGALADGNPTDIGNLVPMKLSFKTMNAAGVLAERLGISAEGVFSFWDSDDGVLRTVSFGADDSGGAGFKVLRVPN